MAWVYKHERLPTDAETKKMIDAVEDKESQGYKDLKGFAKALKQVSKDERK